LEKWGKKLFWPHLKYCPKILLEGLVKIAKKISQDGWSPDRAMNAIPQELEAGAQSTLIDIR
jgi:hypothetical protein